MWGTHSETARALLSLDCLERTNVHGRRPLHSCCTLVGPPAYEPCSTRPSSLGDESLVDEARAAVTQVQWPLGKREGTAYMFVYK